jgi:parallel beta-helix repeat protein
LGEGKLFRRIHSFTLLELLLTCTLLLGSTCIFKTEHIFGSTASNEKAFGNVYSSSVGEFENDDVTLALWHFNEGSGQMVYDASSHGNDGTLGPTPNVEPNDPSWITGFTGQPGDYALSLDDWYDYVLVPDNPDNSLDLNLNDRFTIEFWTYVRQVSRADRGTGYHWNVFVNKRAFEDWTGYTVIQCSYYPLFSAGFYDPSSQNHAVECLPPPTLQWMHVMFTYDGVYLKVYYNGILQGQQEVGSYSVADNGQPLTIGKALTEDVPWTDAVDGIIDEVRISSIARTLGPVHNLNSGLNYQGIQEAIDAPETLNGHTIHVGPGGYGNTTIYKSLSIVGANRDTTSIVGGYPAVRVTANNVQITNFSIDGVYVLNSLNDTISENNIYAYGPWPQYCFTVESSSGLNVCRNTFTTLVLKQCHSNTILENDIVTPDALVPGMWIQQSSHNNISGNTITASGLGIWLDTSCNLNTFSGNRIDAGSYPFPGCYGVEVDSSVGNVFFENCIMKYSVGARLASSSPNNTFYHNNFINNAQQARCNVSIVYRWDYGYPSGGNYWSDYNGTDVFSGPYQNETGNDGIGDTPYVVNAVNIDHYPLFRGLHDIGTVAETSKAGCLPMPTVGIGYGLNITVTMVNYGITTETRNLTLYANTAIIYTVAGITLGSGNSTTFVVECNTTELGYGNHTFTSYCEPVLAEPNTDDNTCSCWIIITIPGDFNGDYMVDIYDAIKLAGAFNSNPTSPSWNQNADINNDDIVDIYDAINLANHYNQHYP